MSYCIRIIPVGERLYVLGEKNTRDARGTMHCLRLTDDGGRSTKRKRIEWSLHKPEESTPIWWSEDPIHLPFRACDIMSHAVHPKGRTIFVSLYGGDTFTYSTESLKWTRRRHWKLPFRGHVIHDADQVFWTRGSDSALPVTDSFPAA
uniref:DUF1618 domain-containing protein n=1 Tax=Leersia perrieri TaxID=77586 RepID=A0A0D9WX03_9ORYZ